VLIVGRRKRVVTILPPAVPLNLALTENPTDLELFWEDVSDNEDGFRLYRSAFSDPFELVAELGPGETYYVDGNIDTAIIYTYYVVSFNAGGESAQSNQVSGEIPAA
jgi:hypothetical protein